MATFFIVSSLSRANPGIYPVILFYQPYKEMCVFVCVYLQNSDAEQPEGNW